MPKPRASKATPGKASRSSDSTAPSRRYVLEPQTKTPPHVFIIPKQVGSTSRIVSLPHPRDDKPTRYLVCPDTGIYEFTKVCAPKVAPRSWLITPEKELGQEQQRQADGAKSTAQLVSGGDLYAATALDPLFLILPALFESSDSKSANEKKRLFLSADDHLEKLEESSSHLSEIIKSPDTRQRILERMTAVCDSVDAGDETMLRLNEQKLLALLLNKAEAFGRAGLPASMESRFVHKALEAPILAQRREVPSSKAPPSGLLTPMTESNESQLETVALDSTAASQASATTTGSASQIPETDTIACAAEAPAEVIRLQRLRVGFGYICGSYLTPVLTDRLTELLGLDTCPVDFKPLVEYLAHLATMRSEALAARSIGGYSRKRGLDEEEEDQMQADKKRKLEEEKRRKASESRGVRDLKKVNTSGMMKLSAFFKKK